MECTPLGGCIGFFLKNFFSNFRCHIKGSKWGRKCIFINCTSCNGSPQQIPFQFANGKLPHSCCRGFWAYLLYWFKAFKSPLYARHPGLRYSYVTRHQSETETTPKKKSYLGIAYRDNWKQWF